MEKTEKIEKERLDKLVSALGYSREKAKALIIAGAVLVNEKPATKAGELYPANAVIRVKGDDCPFVSRGGLKLQKAVDVFGVELAGKVCADLGASSGGFTDCMLKHGARLVYAIDVGYGQLDWTLRNDERVVVMERTNARYLTGEDISGIEFASADVSFISLRLMFPAIAAITTPDAHVVTLIKPQFEAGRENVGKKGVVKDPAVHESVIKNVLGYAAENGLFAYRLDYSPVKGPNGNIEYIAAYAKGGAPAVSQELIRQTVEAAHRDL